MAKQDAVAERARKLVEALRRQRDQGGDAYPLTLAQLAALADPDATPAEMAKALGKKSFAAEAILARKKDPASPVALAEDAERLATSPLLLEYALGKLCHAEAPLQPVAKVVKQVDKALQRPFEAALQHKLETQSLPETVGSQTVKNKPHLYLKQFPPPPPKRPPAEVLAEQLVRTLEAQRAEGDGAYPLPLADLVRKADAQAPPAVVNKAVKLEPFKSRVVPIIPKGPHATVALADDAERVAGSPRVVTAALTAARTPDNQAVPLAKLGKQLAKGLQKPFEDAVNRAIQASALPAGIGCLRISKKPHLFLLADVGAPPPAPPPVAPPPVAKPTEVAPPPPVDFAQQFDLAFDRLDRASGSHNHVSLVGLRQALAADRATFDAGVQELRRSGRYSLSAAEGRHGITPEEQDAGIREEAALLLFVARRTP